MKIIANAKINLTMDITGVRPDGFHTIRSVMVPISLCDELVLEPSGGFSFDCNIKELCGESNLCVRAVRAFCEKTGFAPRFSLYLNKKIPFPAGLGGGSADAAAVLKGLNELYNYPLSDSKLLELGGMLGSDIPFCIFGKPALCEGRGEILTPIGKIPDCNIVIAIGKSRLSTPEVYKKYDEACLPVRNDSDALLAALEIGSIDAISRVCGNAFEPVTDILAPETMTLRQEMLLPGAKCSHLSGSGPSVYGIFADKQSADIAAEKLQNKGYFAVSCNII